MERVTVDPRVRWGTPCIRDTAVPVARVVALHLAGRSAAAVAAEYPGLTDEDVAAALSWYERHGAERLGPRPPEPGPRHPRIVTDPAVQHGVPTIRGTRIPVDVIAGFRRHGYALEEILDEYPTLTADDVRDALGYLDDAGVTA